MQAHDSINLPLKVDLWPQGKAPCASDHDGIFPTLTVYLPSEEYRTGASVLILPGGGYGLVSSAKEGHRPAQFLCSQGVAVAVLEYRHSPQRHPVPLMDAQRGLRVLRNFVGQHGMDSSRVGVMGFSAGGHLSGLLATQPEVDQGRIGDELDEISFVPDFAALLYPVVSLVKEFSHFGSRDHLLGSPAPRELAESLSLEHAVRSDTCPMFLFHTQEDQGVPVQNSMALAEALTRHGVKMELHVFADGEHGIGMGANHPWCRLLLEWIEATANKSCP